jgi:hypothetical protein
MSAIEYCVNFKGCIYIIVDLITFVLFEDTECLLGCL